MLARSFDLGLEFASVSPCSLLAVRGFTSALLTARRAKLSLTPPHLFQSSLLARLLGEAQHTSARCNSGCPARSKQHTTARYNSGCHKLPYDISCLCEIKKSSVAGSHGGWHPEDLHQSRDQKTNEAIAGCTGKTSQRNERCRMNVLNLIPAEAWSVLAAMRAYRQFDRRLPYSESLRVVFQERQRHLRWFVMVSGDKREAGRLIRSECADWRKWRAENVR